MNLMMGGIALDKMWYKINILLILPQNICSVYSLAVPHQSASNEYSKYMFLWRNRKNIDNFWLKKCLIWSYE